MNKKREPKKVSQRDALHYQMLGYRDYVAARKLLIDGYLLQGATLASTALEKYLKCILGTKGLGVDLHLDRVDLFRGVLAENGITIFDEMDPVFVEILSKAYSLRYYDSIKDMHFGFHQWQLLGELDLVISVLELRVSRKLPSGESVLSEYQRAVENKEESIYQENYVLSKQNKKEFMERPGKLTIIILNQNSAEIAIGHENIKAAYQGRLFTVTKESSPAG